MSKPKTLDNIIDNLESRNKNIKQMLKTTADNLNIIRARLRVEQNRQREQTP